MTDRWARWLLDGRAPGRHRNAVASVTARAPGATMPPADGEE